ncbi:MAG TPA: hypothetical protein PKD26_16320 [Pyrinomonadaceae bacterium]|nr:hypothetical protein [Pyrinomonadaceae bacterium]
MSSVLIGTACFRSFQASRFDKEVDALIELSCSSASACRIRIAEATNLDWDEMYVLRHGLLGVEAEKLLPGAKEFRGEFNRKIAFVKSGQIIRFDEAAEFVEGEHTPDGTLIFDSGAEGNADILRYDREAEFEVTNIKLSRGIGYTLKCSNCTQSPVFAEYGKATEPDGR